MAERLSEHERRALAQANRDDFVDESAEPVAPKRLGQMVSLRLDPDVAIALRDLASERGMSLSDLLREAAARVLADASTSVHFTPVQWQVIHGGAQHTIDNQPPTGSRAAGPQAPDDIQVAIAA